jgi:hypothetical protein
LSCPSSFLKIYVKCFPAATKEISPSKNLKLNVKVFKYTSYYNY